MNLIFVDKLKSCECCPRKCGVDRLNGEKGVCGISSETVVAHSGLHFGEEPPISGTKGSGTIFFAGCNLKCVFCQNYQISQEFTNEKNRVLSATKLADEMIRLQDEGAHNINFVSPSHMVYQMADAIVTAKSKGLRVPVVYNTNGYDSVEALRNINGLVDIYLPDLKYIRNDLSYKYSNVKDYTERATDAIAEMFDQAGALKKDENGVAISGLLIRHLVLPGAPENSFGCLNFIAGLSTEISVSLMSQYSPQYHSDRFPEINRPVTVEEYKEVVDYAVNSGLKNLFIQELESSDNYIPDFSKDFPFETD